jgi:uncharacterized protein (DUF2141 family)
MREGSPVSGSGAGKLIAAWSGAWLAAACLAMSPAMADEAHADLVVNAGGFAHERGQAMASLFREGDDIFGKPHARVAAPIHQGRATLVFPNTRPGHYALIAFHDANGNNDLDHNFLHLPAEPLGFSNGFELSLFSGMPSFEKLRFVFTAGSGPQEISIK